MISGKLPQVVGLSLGFLACSEPSPEEKPSPSPSKTESAEDDATVAREVEAGATDVSDDVTASTLEESRPSSSPLDAGPIETELPATAPTLVPDASGTADVEASPLDAGAYDTEPTATESTNEPDAASVTEDCPVEYRAGHGDLFLAYDETHGLTLSLRSHLIYPEPVGVPPEHDPDDVCIVVPSSSHAEVVELGGRPEFSEFEPIGVDAGKPFWFLSQNNRGPLEPFLGLSTEGVPSAAFAGALRFEFHPLDPAAAGEFSLYQSGFPPRFFVSTRSPERTQSGAPVVELGTGVHDHYNWTFSKPGRYDLRVIASGQLAGASEVRIEQIYKFLIEEP